MRGGNSALASVSFTSSLAGLPVEESAGTGSFKSTSSLAFFIPVEGGAVSSTSSLGEDCPVEGGAVTTSGAGTTPAGDADTTSTSSLAALPVEAGGAGLAGLVGLRGEAGLTSALLSLADFFFFSAVLLVLFSFLFVF